MGVGMDMGAGMVLCTDMGMSMDMNTQMGMDMGMHMGMHMGTDMDMSKPRAKSPQQLFFFGFIGLS